MNPRYLLALLLALLAGTITRSQDTLFLSVNSTMPDKVTLRDNNGRQYSTDDTLQFPGGDWFFRISNPARLSFKVSIRNNALNFERKEIPDLTTTYRVLNNYFILSSSDGMALSNEFTLMIDGGASFSKKFDLNNLPLEASVREVPVSSGTGTLKKQDTCGVAYYDVIFLKDPSSDPLTKLKILAWHAKTTIGGLDSALAGNRFLLPYYTAWSEQRKASAQSAGSLASAALGALGGLDVTNIADGLSRFIVKRAKTELNIAFFDQFRKALADTSLRDLQTLFPSTWMALDQIGDRIYDYNRYLQVLRESFESDLQNLPSNLPGIIENHPDFFDKNPWLMASLKGAFYLSDGLMNHVHPGDLIAGFPLEYLGDPSLAGWKGSLQTLQLFSEMLRDRQGSGRYWISRQQAATLTADADALKIWIGLLRQHAVQPPYNGISFPDGTTLSGMIDRIDPAVFGTWYNAYRDYLTGFVSKAEKVSAMIMNWQKPSADSVAFLQYYRFIRATIDLVEQGTSVGNLPGLDALKIKADLNTWFEISRTAADLALDVSYKNYSCALFKAVYIYDLVMVKIGKPANTAMASSDAAVSRTRSFLDQYGPFIAAMAQARNSKEVEEAIEAAALPPGSARIKRETRFNVALNAYVGPYAGYEQIVTYDTTGFQLNTFGITAPVGIALSRGHSVFFIGTGKAGWSSSVFVSLIDLGAVTSFRFKDDSTSQIPTVHLQDIFSPGLFLSIGIPKWPLSVNFGAQMGPNLRTVTATSNDYSDKVYFRYSASVVVDIPIFNFYSKSRY